MTKNQWSLDIYFIYLTVYGCKGKIGTYIWSMHNTLSQGEQEFLKSSLKDCWTTKYSNKKTIGGAFFLCWRELAWKFSECTSMILNHPHRACLRTRLKQLIHLALGYSVGSSETRLNAQTIWICFRAKYFDRCLEYFTLILSVIKWRMITGSITKSVIKCIRKLLTVAVTRILKSQAFLLAWERCLNNFFFFFLASCLEV